jgi:hypothetical protein
MNAKDFYKFQTLTHVWGICYKYHQMKVPNLNQIQIV